MPTAGARPGEARPARASESRGEVADLVGHTTPALVIKRYGYALPQRTATAGDRLERFLAENA